VTSFEGQVDVRVLLTAVTAGVLVGALLFEMWRFQRAQESPRSIDAVPATEP
jgi:hypothetical protein